MLSGSEESLSCSNGDAREELGSSDFFSNLLRRSISEGRGRLRFGGAEVEASLDSSIFFYIEVFRLFGFKKVHFKQKKN